MYCQSVAYTDNLQQNIGIYICVYITRKWKPIPVAARSKACVFGCSITGIAGSNPAERKAYSSLVFAVCCVVSGLCYELINRLGDSYRVCVSECDLYHEDVLAQRGWGVGRGVKLHRKRERKFYV